MTGMRAIIALLAALAGPAWGAELVLIAPADQTMPLVEFKQGKLSSGILKDVGELLARRLGRQARFVTVAGDQIGGVMQRAEVDGICYMMPGWIDGNYNWSSPLIPDAELVAALPSAPRVRALSDLAGVQVGTVAAYRYPRVEQVLDERFIRVDAPSTEQNLARQMKGEVAYSIVGKNTLAYQMRINPAINLRTDIVFAAFRAHCAFTKRPALPFAQIEKLIKGMAADGSIERIMARYH